MQQRGPTPPTAMLHQMQRHRDILQDYVHEFRKTRDNITGIRDREQLLAYHKRDASLGGGLSSRRGGENGFQKERETIDR